MTKRIEALLERCLTLYEETYPERNKHPAAFYINALHFDPTTGEGVQDTGVCYLVGYHVRRKLHALGIPVRLVFLWRDYNSENGNGFEDELTHCALELEGCFYDTVDLTGVDRVEDLEVYQFFNCTSTTTEETDERQFNVIDDDTPYHLALKTL